MKGTNILFWREGLGNLLSSKQSCKPCKNFLFDNFLSVQESIQILKKVFAIIGSNCLKVWILFYFWPNVFLLCALGFQACIVWPLGWLWLKKKFVYVWLSWSFSPQLFLAWFRVEKSWTTQWLSSSGSFRLVSL